MKNRFYSIKCSDGTTKNFTKFATGEISLQIIQASGKVSKPKLLNGR